MIIKIRRNLGKETDETRYVNRVPVFILFTSFCCCRIFENFEISFFSKYRNNMEASTSDNTCIIFDMDMFENSKNTLPELESESESDSCKSLKDSLTGPITELEGEVEHANPDKCSKNLSSNYTEVTTNESKGKAKSSPRRRSILKSPSTVIDSTDSSCNSSRSEVRFDSVQVRGYSIVLGDHPSCSYGPPVSLDWGFDEYKPVAVDLYEDNRGPRRSMREMLMNYYHRKHILTVFGGYTEEDLKRATNVVKKTQRERYVTRAFLPCRKVEEVVASARRKVKRLSKKKVGEPMKF